MHFARRLEPHASKGLPVTSDDLVPRILDAIEAEEANAHGGEHRRGHTDDCDWWGDVPGYCTCGSKDRVLRRCAAGREIVELHGIVWRDIGWLAEEDGEVVEEEAELPVCGLCVPRHSSFPRREDVPVGPCRTVRLLARGYGISTEEVTGG